MNKNDAGKSRRKARKFALMGVYQAIIDPSATFESISRSIPDVIVDDGPCELTLEDFEECDKSFYAEILKGVLDERADLERAVSVHLDREIGRLSVTEHACLIIGAWELSHCPNTPYRVVINEALELSKEFGADRGYRLVNGVLDKVAADLRPAEANSRG